MSKLYMTVSNKQNGYCSQIKVQCEALENRILLLRLHIASLRYQ